jgi:hypothetical protein
MNLVVRIFFVGISALVALSPVSRASSCAAEIDSDRAYALAATYRLRFISLCGASGEPILHANYWEVPIVVGQGAEPAGSIRVDRHTGKVSYRGKPTVTPEYLEAWEKSLEKPHRKP